MSKGFIVIFGQSVIRRGVWCIVVVAGLHDLERFWWCTAVHRGGRVNRNIDGVRGGAVRGRSARRTKSGCHSKQLFSGFLISWLMWAGDAPGNLSLCECLSKSERGSGVAGEEVGAAQLALY